MDSPQYRIGRFGLTPFRQLLDGGTPVAIGRKPLELLSVLAKAEGALVTKDELMAAVWPKAIVEDNAIQVHIAAVRKALGEEAELLSTVHGFGYRLAAIPAEPEIQAGAPVHGKIPRQWFWPVAGAAIVCIITAAGFWLVRDHPSGTAKPSEPRVAVLPFDTLSAGPQARQFADALTDEMVTRLSNRIQVVSRLDAATLRGPDGDRKLDQLGVSLLFDGTVQDDGNTVKVRLHLDDPARHVTLWSRSVDGPAANGGELQASIADTIVAVLACSSRALAPVHGLSDPDLLSRYLHACDVYLNGPFSRGSFYEQLASLREVAAKAPDFTPAHSDLAKFDTYYAPRLPPDQGAPLAREGEAEARKALALDPKSPDAYLSLAVLRPMADWAGREKLLRQGVAGDPDWPFTNAVLGLLLAGAGRVQEASAYLQKAVAANLQIDWSVSNAVVQCGAGQFEPATGLAFEALKLRPKNSKAGYILRHCLKDARRWADLRNLAMTSPSTDKANLQDPSSPLYDVYLVAEESATPADVARARSAALAEADSENPATKANAIEALTQLGFIDDAFAVANRFNLHVTGDTDFLFFPLTAPLRRDPRFMRLAARFGLVDYWRRSGHWPDFCADPALSYNCQAEAGRLAGAR